MGRFLNADSQINPQVGLLGLYMFAYCANNPENASDPTGHIFMFLTAAIGAAVGAVVGGCIAAANGKNFWKGAAVGVLVGLRVGAAAGIALAGNAMASTAAVATGASALVTTVATSGFAAGGAMLLNNISNACSRGGAQVVDGMTQTGKNTYYQVTSNQAAQSIASSGKLIPSTVENQYVY